MSSQANAPGPGCFADIHHAGMDPEAESNDCPDYCKTITIRDANGALKRFVFPKALDLDRPKRARTTFSGWQLEMLETDFQANQYLVGKERTDLARRLGLSETQVKVWFQNRRTKFKKDKERQSQKTDSVAESLATKSVLKLLEYKTPSTFSTTSPLLQAQVSSSGENHHHHQQQQQIEQQVISGGNTRTSHTQTNLAHWNALQTQAHGSFHFPVSQRQLQTISEPVHGCELKDTRMRQSSRQDHSNSSQPYYRTPATCFLNSSMGCRPTSGSHQLQVQDTFHSNGPAVDAVLGKPLIPRVQSSIPTRQIVYQKDMVNFAFHGFRY